MSDAVYRLRRTLEAFLRAESKAALAELRGESPVGLAQALRHRFASLGEDSAYEAAAQIAPYAAVESREPAATREHLRRFRGLTARAREREICTHVWTGSLPALGSRSPLEAVAALSRGEQVPHLVGALEQAVEPALAELLDLARDGEPDADPEIEPEPETRDTDADVGDWLEGTADLFAAAFAYLLAGADEPGPLLAVLTASPFSPGGRLRRAGARCEPWGLAAALPRTKLVAPRRDSPLGVRLVPTDPPAIVHLAAAPLELGLLSEFDAAHAVGRAQWRLWVSPALPAALRWPSDDTVGQVFGGLSAQLLWTPDALDTCIGAAERERQRRRVGALLLGAVRLCAGWARWALGTLDAASAQDAWREAVGVSLSPALAFVLTPDAGRCIAMFRGAIDALGVWVALRERLDEDWYLNPRAADVLRAAAERGGGLSSDAWLTELGGRPTDALGRAHELFPS